MTPLVAASQVIKTIIRFTENPKMPLQQVSILLCVMDRGEVPMGDLPDLAGVSQEAISRNCAQLGRGLTLNDPGYHLLETFEDPAYRRRKLVKLSPKGEEMKAAIKAIGGSR